MKSCSVEQNECPISEKSLLKSVHKTLLTRLRVAFFICMKMTWSTLHDLCAQRPTPFATAAIIKRAREVPDEIVYVDDRGYTPLHIAVTLRHKPPLEAIEALVDLCPIAVMAKVSMASIFKERIRKRYLTNSTFDVLIHSWMAKDLHGDTPMHLALRPGASPDLIRLLLHACPNVTYEPNKEGLMPLHVACRYCCNEEEIIRLLLEANPIALRSRTKMGNLVQRKKSVSELVPHDNFTKSNRHLVLDGTTSSSWKSSQIKTSSETQFEERSIQLRDGSYPLHMAVANGAPLIIIDMLIKAAPDVLSWTDKFERTCLHLAVANGATIDFISSIDPITSQIVYNEHRPKTTLEVIELLHLMDKSLVTRKDNRKNYPLHTALQGGCSAGCIEYLIRTYPQAINSRNEDGMLPLELALKFGCCSQNVLHFLKLGQESALELRSHS